jgi:hypothetical protein
MQPDRLRDTFCSDASLFTAACRKTDIVRHVENGSTKPYFGWPVFKVIVVLFRHQCVWYNCSMTEALQEAFMAIRELPDDVQDSIATRLMQLMDLASWDED